MYTPRANWVLFITFTILSLVVFIAALVFPVVRSFSYAPLRDLILPPPKPITITLLYSTEKEAWLKESITRFEEDRITYQGRPIVIQTEKMGSREMYLAVLDEKKKPVILSPASSLQTSILEDLSTSKFGQPLIQSTVKESCQSVVISPLVLVAWRERAETLWGTQPPVDLWRVIHKAVIDPRGWATYGHEDWGYVKFGHTDPLKSNSGFMTILLMAYDYHQKSGHLTTTDILDTGFQDWFVNLETTISQFGESTGTYMRDIIAYGPSVYDIVSVYEATAIEQADNAIGRYGELRIYYPPATIYSDHPFCVLNGAWVTPEQAAAAHLFIEYLLRKEIQELALVKYGFRPVNPDVNLDIPGSPFTRYAVNGLLKTIPPQAELPDGVVLNTLLDLWSRNVNR